MVIYEGDTIKSINCEHLLAEELFKDENEMKGVEVTSSFDHKETMYYTLTSLMNTTEFIAIGEKKRFLGSKYLTMRNLATNELYGIKMHKTMRLDYYVVNLTQERKIAKEQYAHNLAKEKEMRGQWDRRIQVKPHDIYSDIAVWNEKRIIINGIEYSFADITGCDLSSKEVYKEGKLDHVKIAKDMRKKQGWGEILGGKIGMVVGTVLQPLRA